MDNGAENTLQEALEVWDAWVAKKKYQKDVIDECKQLDEQAMARLTEAMEKGVASPATKSAIDKAYTLCVTSWADYTEVLAQIKVMKKDARDEVTDAAAILNQTMNDAKQTLLPLDSPDPLG